MKTLANCSTKEFLVKTNAIRHKAEKFIKTLSTIDVSPLYEKIKDVDRTDRKELLKVTYPLISLTRFLKLSQSLHSPLLKK